MLYKIKKTFFNPLYKILSMKFYKFSFFYLFCSTAVMTKAYSSSLVFPYQKCSKQIENYTKNLVNNVSDTEAKFCPECSKEDLSFNPFSIFKNTNDELHKFIIPKECFIAVSARGNKMFRTNQYVRCKNKEDTRYHKGYRICANEEYIDMIQKTFSHIARCFNFDIHRQKEIFHLINQESGGILNARSKTRARCLGQVTIDYVNDINRYIRSAKRSKQHLKYAEIYNEVIQRCPELEKAVLKDINSITCRMTQDPYTCLFYTFFGLEQNHRKIKDNLNSETNYMGNKAFTKAEKEKFKLPIKLKEILNVEALVDGKKIHWTFWDDSEVYQAFKKSKRDIKVLSVEKIPLFENQDDIELLFSYWSHNGGSTFSKGRMISMIEKLKQNISRSCKNNSKEHRCYLRKQIQKGQSISANGALIESFEMDILRSYPSRRRIRREEVAYYVRNLMNTSKRVFNYKENSGQTQEMVKYYKKAVKFKDIELSEEDANRFQQHISQVCPKIEILN